MHEVLHSPAFFFFLHFEADHTSTHAVVVVVVVVMVVVAEKNDFHVFSEKYLSKFGRFGESIFNFFRLRKNKTKMKIHFYKL